PIKTLGPSMVGPFSLGQKKDPNAMPQRVGWGLDTLAMRGCPIQHHSHDIPVASSWRLALDLFPLCSILRPCSQNANPCLDGGSCPQAGFDQRPSQSSD